MAPRWRDACHCCLKIPQFVGVDLHEYDVSRIPPEDHRASAVDEVQVGAADPPEPARRGVPKDLDVALAVLDPPAAVDPVLLLLLLLLPVPVGVGRRILLLFGLLVLFSLII